MKLKALGAGVSRNSLLAGTALLLLILQTIAWMLQNPFPGHDQCSYLFEARRLLQGAELYGPYIAETNPPLIIWFSVIPVFFSHLFHTKETTMFYVVLSVLVCVSVLWCVRLAERSGWGKPSLMLLAGVLLFIECPQMVLLFGQRENLLLICILPYALGVALSAPPKISIYECCALGAFAGVAVCFKPQQTLLLVGIEIATLVITRSLRHLRSPEFLCATLVCVLYVGAIALCAPLYFKTLPLLVDVYWALGSYRADVLMLHQFPGLLVLGVVAAVSFRFLKGSEDRRAVLFPVTCALAASAAFAIQHTGWGYQQYPTIAFTALAAVVLVILLLRALLEVQDGVATPLLKYLAFSLTALLLAAQWRMWRPVELPNDAGVFDGLHAGDSVYVITTDVSFFAVVYARDLEWGSRFMHLWMLPAIFENEHRDRPADAPFKQLSPSRLAELSSLQRTELAADLDHWKPKIVLVENCPCPFIHQDVDLLQWFSAEPVFRSAWKPYVEAKDVTGLRVFRRTE